MAAGNKVHGAGVRVEDRYCRGSAALPNRRREPRAYVGGRPTVTAGDPRRAIVLDPPARALVLTEMRDFDVRRPWRTPCGRAGASNFAPGKIV
jgi:hypothetical protein